MADGRLDYQAVHWGDAPRCDLDLAVWDYATTRVRSLGVARAISYGTRKGGEQLVWRHEFERTIRVFVPGTDRARSSRPTPTRLIAVGLLVDIELSNGRVLLVPGAHVVTDATGQSIWLATAEERVAIEQIDDGPIVTEHGIER